MYREDEGIFKYQDLLDIMNEHVPTLARIATDVQ